MAVRVMNGLAAMGVMLDFHAARQIGLVRDVMAVRMAHTDLAAHGVADFAARRVVGDVSIGVMDRIPAVRVVMNDHAVLVVLDVDDVVAVGMNAAAMGIVLFSAVLIGRRIFRERGRGLVLLVASNGIAEAEVLHGSKVIAALSLVEKILPWLHVTYRHGG